MHKNQGLRLDCSFLRKRSAGAAAQGPAHRSRPQERRGMDGGGTGDTGDVGGVIPPPPKKRPNPSFRPKKEWA